MERAGRHVAHGAISRTFSKLARTLNERLSCRTRLDVETRVSHEGKQREPVGNSPSGAEMKNAAPLFASEAVTANGFAEKCLHMGMAMIQVAFICFVKPKPCGDPDVCAEA